MDDNGGAYVFFQRDIGKEFGKGCVKVHALFDGMVKWFCILFNNQFTPDEMYDNYPTDRLMHDIALAPMTVQPQTTEELDFYLRFRWRRKIRK